MKTFYDLANEFRFCLREEQIFPVIAEAMQLPDIQRIVERNRHGWLGPEADFARYLYKIGVTNGNHWHDPF